MAIFIASVLALSLIPAAALTASAAPAVYDGTTVSSSLAGEGTEAAPFIIANGADLAFFAAKITALTADDTAFYKLTDDIVWSAYVSGGTVPAANNWTPIDGKFFKGTRRSRHTISGLYIDCVLETGTAMFSFFAGTLKNLTIKDSYFAANHHVAGFVASVSMVSDTVNLVNLKNYAPILAKVLNSYSGGIVGESDTSSLNVVGCINYGSVESLAGNGYIGGVIGNVTKSVKTIVSGCANFGEIKGVSALAGGIAGSSGNTSGDMTYDTNPIDYIDCLNAGTVSGIRIIGGVIGRANKGVKMTNCVNIGEVLINADAAGDEKASGFGGIGGSLYRMSEENSLSNCYYLTGAAKNTVVTDAVSATESRVGQTAKTSAELMGAGVVAALGLNAEVWSDGAADAFLTIGAVKTPDTSDNTMIIFWTILAVSAFGGAVVTVSAFRKKKTER